MLLVSDTCADDGPHNLYLLQRWFPLMFAISGGYVAMLPVLPVLPLGSFKAQDLWM